MKTATVRARVEPALKSEIEAVLNELGLSVSEAIELYLHQIKLMHGIPFDIRLPNKVTQQTFKKTDEGSELNVYNNPDDLFKNLEIDACFEL